MSKGSIRLLIVGEQEIVTGGIAALLAPYTDSIEIDVLPNTQCHTTSVAVDVVVYDALALVDGRPEGLNQLVAMSKGVIAIGRDLRPDLAARAISQGALLTVSIGSGANELVRAIEAVYTGETAGLLPSQERLAQAEGLSEREAEVLGLITRGLTNPEIAERLFLSINSIKTYVRSAYRKIGATRRTQAVAWALEHGFSTGEP